MKLGLIKPIVWATLAVALVVGGYLGAIQLSGNFYEVIPGELYRSNQPTANQIANYVKRYGIKSIINLRGADDGAAWYRDEVHTAATLGVKHVDFKMSSSQEMTLDQSLALVSLLRDAPKPLLIHCRSGADRTGLASVIYLQQIAKVDEETAEKQLSVRFGHIGIPYVSPSYAMDENWEMLEKVFGLAG